MSRAGISLFVLCAALVGCERSEGPDVAWKRFVEATRKGDSATAWSLLSKRTQEELTRAAVEVAEARGVMPPSDGRALMTSAPSLLVAPPKAIEARFENSDEAIVRVLDADGQRGSVHALHEEGEWRFDLASVLPPPKRL